jgi:hypothetical protein
MKALKFFILSLMALTLSCIARGQAYVDSLAHEDHEIAAAIAPYPADVRTAILEASQYPQALVKLERLQDIRVKISRRYTRPDVTPSCSVS